jgi:hypothetical protein
MRDHRERDESGAVLILALVYIFAISLVVSALAGWAMNDLNNTTAFKKASALHYALTSAVNVGIESIRYTPNPSTTPAQGVATAPLTCWAPTSPSTLSDLTVNGYDVAVWCSTVEELSESTAPGATRMVTVYACLNVTGITGSACAAKPLLTAVVAIDDYPGGYNGQLYQQCNVINVQCGDGTTLMSWIWGSGGASTSTTVPVNSSQTVSFYNSSYTSTITNATAIYGASSNSYQLYARGSGNGILTYASTSPIICTISASGTVAILSAGACTVTADAGPTAGYNDSGPASFPLTVSPASTTVAVVSSINPSALNQQLTYTATVSVTSPGTGNPTGSVKFLDGGVAISGCSAQALTGSSTDTATCTQSYTTSGNHTITAQYLGTTNYASSPASPTVVQTVNSSSYSGGSGSVDLPTAGTGVAEYFQANGTAGPVATQTGNGLLLSATSSTTLTAITLTTNSTSPNSQTVTVGIINGSTWTATALTCTVVGNSNLTTCGTTTNVVVPAGDSINIQGIGNGHHTGTWVITHT